MEQATRRPRQGTPRFDQGQFLRGTPTTPQKQTVIAQRAPEVQPAPRPQAQPEPQAKTEPRRQVQASTRNTTAASKERAEAGHTSYVLLGRGADALGRLDWSWDTSGHHLKAALYLHHLQAKHRKVRPNLGSRELARHLGVSKTTAERILTELERRGVVARHGTRRKNDPARKDFYAQRWSVLFSHPGRPDPTDGHDMTVAEMLAALGFEGSGMGQGDGPAFTRENRGVVGQGDGPYLSSREGASEGSGEPSSEPEQEDEQPPTVPPAGAGRPKPRRSLKPKGRRQ